MNLEMLAEKCNDDGTKLWIDPDLIDETEKAEKPRMSIETAIGLTRLAELADDFSPYEKPEVTAESISWDIVSFKRQEIKDRDVFNLPEEEQEPVIWEMVKDAVPQIYEAYTGDATAIVRFFEPTSWEDFSFLTGKKQVKNINDLAGYCVLDFYHTCTGTVLAKFKEVFTTIETELDEIRRMNNR